MNFKFKLSNYVEVFNLDAVLAGFSLSYFIAWYEGVAVSLLEYLILMGVIWVVYSLDHLMDAQKAHSSLILFRRAFYKNHFKAIFFMIGLIAILLFGLCLEYLDPEIWFLGMGLFSICIGHLFLAQLGFVRYYPKELVIAFVFTCGVFLLPFARLKAPFEWFQVILFLHVFSTVTLNLFIISFFERSLDRLDGFHNIANFSGTRKFLLAMLIFIVLNFLSLLVLIWKKDSWHWELLILTIISVWPILCICFYRTIKKKQRYLIWSDKLIWLYGLVALFLN